MTAAPRGPRGAPGGPFGWGTVGMRMITRCSMVTCESWIRVCGAAAWGVAAPAAAISITDTKTGDAKSSKT